VPPPVEPRIHSEWEAQSAIRVERATFERRARFFTHVPATLSFFMMVGGIAIGSPGPGTLLGLAILAVGIVSGTCSA
jgi:hypothetical protein